MTTDTLRKTHPMVLTAAAAVTVFSMIGSAAITGMIPSAHSSRSEFVEPAAGNEQTSPVDRPSTADAKPDSFKSTVTGKGSATSVNASQEKTASSSPAANGKATATCGTCGVIESIRAVEQEGDGSGLGAVAGGVLGGVVGNQMGKGKGNTLMTIIGLGGGAYAGHTIEKQMKSSTAYVVKVRMNDGTYRKITQQIEPSFAVGDHVKVVKGSLTAA